MDGATFDINIAAKSIGVDAAVGDLNALAAKIKQADTVATNFDSAVAAASSQLEKASAAARLASEALGAAEKQYQELESAANTAAKAVEKAAAAGKDTKDLASAAAAAKTKMEEQAKAVDALKAKSTSANSVQQELSDTLGILKGKQSDATKEIKNFAPAAEKSEISGKDLKKALIGVEAGAAIVAAAVIGTVIALGAFAVMSNRAASNRLERAMQRLQLGFRNLFSGLKLDKFISGLEDIGTLFDKGTSSANGMKTLIETIFQPLFDGAAKAAPLVKEMFKGMIHGALLAVIAVLEIRNAILKAMSPETRQFIKDVAAKVFTLHNAFMVGTVVAVSFAIAIAALVVVVAALVAPVVAIVEAIMHWGEIVDWFQAKFGNFGKGLILTVEGILAPFYALGKGILQIVQKAGQWGADIAAAIISGLTGGLAGGSDAVNGAMGKVLKAAKTSAASALDSHSPSKVYEKLGATIPAGLVQGVESGHDDVKAAVDATVGQAPSGGNQTTVGGARSLHIGTLNVGKDPVSQKTWADLRRLFLEMLEGDNLTIGGGETPAT